MLQPDSTMGGGAVKRPADEQPAPNESEGAHKREKFDTMDVTQDIPRAQNPATSPARHLVIKEDTPNDTILPLNVSGTRFTTTLGALRRCPDSHLWAMFSGRHSNLARDEHGSFLLSRNPILFGIVLGFLEDGNCARVRALACEM